LREAAAPISGPMGSRSFAPLALAAAGFGFAALATADKLFGLVQRPLHLATFAYAALIGLVTWCVRHGFPPRAPRRVSLFSAFLLLNLLTAGYVLAWRVSADPTPLLLQTELARGDALLDAGRKDEAHLVYRDAGRRYPRSFPILMRLGAVNYQVEDFDRARRYYERAAAVAPRDSRWRALNDLAQTYWKLLRPEEAIQTYLAAHEEGIPPFELAEWHYRIAWAYFDVSDYDSAIEHYHKVARSRSKYAASSYYNIGCALAQKLKQMPPGPEREQVAREASEFLKLAWEAERDPAEREALRVGLSGPPGERDPELFPLRRTRAFQALLRDLFPGSK